MVLYIYSMVHNELLIFLDKLQRNNDRDWFNKHKAEFKKLELDTKQFFQQVEDRLQEMDVIERHVSYRIYRDVRFAKDRTPYNNWLSASFVRATASRRGSYYLKLQPGGSVAGGGFYGPNKDDLLRIRQEFEFDDGPIRKILNDPNFVDLFGGLKGEELKTAPRGFSTDHQAIDLIRKKQFYVTRSFTDKEVCSPNFMDELLRTFEGVRPYFDYMSEMLTTNMNGESLLIDR